jgi:SAM-dependent methyltransferase
VGARGAQLYDTIGPGYRAHRRPDPRVAAAIAGALGEAATVVNVGAGAGSYEPADRAVVAVEPSPAMIAQRAAGSAPVVQASATHLPFGDAAFDAALAVLTVHHWPDRPRGLAELARVARARVVLLTWDPATPGFWLVDEYFPEIWAIDRPIFPTLADLRGALGAIEVRPLPVPHDCTDGFLGAYWRRPEAYLDPGVRGAISTFTKLRDVGPGLARLRRDLADGTWRRRHADLLERTELDLGYRLVVAEQPRVGRREGSSCEAPPEDRARGVLPVR